MNKYKIKYYTSGGYKASGDLLTDYCIKEECNQLRIYDKGVDIGGVEYIEKLFLEKLGYIEDITIFKVELESSR